MWSIEQTDTFEAWFSRLKKLTGRMSWPLFFFYANGVLCSRDRMLTR